MSLNILSTHATVIWFLHIEVEVDFIQRSAFVHQFSVWKKLFSRTHTSKELIGMENTNEHIKSYRVIKEKSLTEGIDRWNIFVISSVNSQH